MFNSFREPASLCARRPTAPTCGQRKKGRKCGSSPSEGAGILLYLSASIRSGPRLALPRWHLCLITACISRSFFIFPPPAVPTAPRRFNLFSPDRRLHYAKDAARLGFASLSRLCKGFRASCRDCRCDEFRIELNACSGAASAGYGVEVVRVDMSRRVESASFGRVLALIPAYASGADLLLYCDGNLAQYLRIPDLGLVAGIWHFKCWAISNNVYTWQEFGRPYCYRYRTTSQSIPRNQLQLALFKG